MLKDIKLSIIHHNYKLTNKRTPMIKVYISMLLLSIGSFSCAQEPVLERLKAAEYELKIQELPNAYLIDVRTPPEVAGGTIGDAVNIDFLGSDFKPEVEKLDKSKPVLVYCAVGGRSWKAAQLLNQLGFKEVYDLDGGIKGWQQAGKPLNQ
ncbi:rhodanese-like domain-containing protein [Flexithrix dorotheae]|uniref:rhodanese-like domain-containing protein n=1 Tax=Flexithrix dorotheae TaxID=70993 RepID=UPI00037AC12F|nr:rhodanese-like domain-containing protein [Flexithrix dorotheae]